MSDKVEVRVRKVDSRYTVFKLEDEVLDHKGNRFEVLNESFARHLAEDLAEVFERREADVRHSFVYCMLSTFNAHKVDQIKYASSLDLETVIQWDRAFRLSPGPPALMHQMRAVEPIQNYLGGLYENIGLNYSCSLDEMIENEVDFLSEALVSRVGTTYSELSEVEKFTVDFLHQFYGRTSVVLPILWCIGEITDEELQFGGWTFEYEGLDGIDVEDKNFKFFINRLSNLKRLMNEDLSELL